MGDFDRITGFEWDEGNEWKSYVRHDVSQQDAEQVFFSASLLVAKDRAHSQSELRYHALGVIPDGRHLHVSFTLRDDETRIRIISAREMSPKERRWYGIGSGIGLRLLEISLV